MSCTFWLELESTTPRVPEGRLRSKLVQMKGKIELHRYPVPRNPAAGPCNRKTQARGTEPPAGLRPCGIDLGGLLFQNKWRHVNLRKIQRFISFITRVLHISQGNHRCTRHPAPDLAISGQNRSNSTSERPRVALIEISSDSSLNFGLKGSIPPTFWMK